MSIRKDIIKKTSMLDAIYMVLLSIVFSVISILIFILIITLGGFGIDIFELFESAVINVLNNPKSILSIFYWATPLMLTGLAVAVAFQAGLFNIGGQGQMLIGGVAAAIWAAAGFASAIAAAASTASSGLLSAIAAAISPAISGAA